MLSHLYIWVLPLVLNFNTSAFIEGHGEIAVGSTIAAELVQFGRLDRHREGERLKIAGHRITWGQHRNFISPDETRTNTKKVAERREYRWLGLIVPVHLDDNFSVASVSWHILHARETY